MAETQNTYNPDLTALLALKKRLDAERAAKVVAAATTQQPSTLGLPGLDAWQALAQAGIEPGQPEAVPSLPSAAKPPMPSPTMPVVLSTSGQPEPAVESNPLVESGIAPPDLGKYPSSQVPEKPSIGGALTTPQSEGSSLKSFFSGINPALALLAGLGFLGAKGNLGSLPGIGQGMVGGLAAMGEGYKAKQERVKEESKTSVAQQHVDVEKTKAATEKKRAAEQSQVDAELAKLNPALSAAITARMKELMDITLPNNERLSPTAAHVLASEQVNKEQGTALQMKQAAAKKSGIIFGGKTYAKYEDLPPEGKKAYDARMKQ